MSRPGDSHDFGHHTNTLKNLIGSEESVISEKDSHSLCVCVFKLSNYKLPVIK